MYWVGLVLLVITSILALGTIILLIYDFDVEILLLSIMLLAPMLFISSLMVKQGSGSKKEKSPKIEVLRTEKVLETEKVDSNPLTAEFFSAEGFSGILGIYELEGGMKYDLANQEIYTEVEKDFETQRLVIFDNISTIEQFQQFCNLKGIEKDFSKYFNSN